MAPPAAEGDAPGGGAGPGEGAGRGTGSRAAGSRAALRARPAAAAKAAKEKEEEEEQPGPSAHEGGGGEQSAPPVAAKRRRMRRREQREMVAGVRAVLVLLVTAFLGLAALRARYAGGGSTPTAAAPPPPKPAPPALHAPWSAAGVAAGGPLICAHGGDAVAAPPNTRAAIEAALAAGANCIELDVTRTADGALVALHARELQQLLPERPGVQARAPPLPLLPCAFGRRSRPPSLPRPALKHTLPPLTHVQVADLTLAELAALSWPSGDGVPSVADALAAAAPARALVIDLKTGAVGDAALAAAAAALVGGGACAGGARCVVWSRDDALLAEFARLAPPGAAAVGYVVVEGDAAAGADPARVTPAGRLPGAAVAAFAHTLLGGGDGAAAAAVARADAAGAAAAAVARADAAGAAVFAYIVDGEADIERVLRAGARGIITNEPALAAAVAARLRAEAAASGGRQEL